MPYSLSQVRALFAKYPKAKARRIVDEGGVKRGDAHKTKKTKRRK